MLFNSPEFLVFLPIVFGLYWFVTHRHLRVAEPPAAGGFIRLLWLVGLALPRAHRPLHPRRLLRRHPHRRGR